MTLQVEIQDLRRMLKEKCEEIFSDKELALKFYLKICEIENDDRFTMVEELLKEQETVKPKIDAFGHPYCPRCKILVYETWEFCPHCGKAVKWNADNQRDC